MNLLRNIAFGAVMILYLWFPFSMIVDQQQILEKGEVFRFRPRPVDPNDAFRGRYIVLRFMDQNLNFPDAQSVFKHDDKIFVSLQKDSLGYVNLSNPSFEKPEGKNYLKTKVLYTNEDRVAVEIPENLRRYYLNEKLAPLAEEKFRELQRNSDSNEVKVYLDARVLGGEVLIDELYFEGTPVSEYLENL
jgi:GDYXXLXY protein